MVRKLFNKYKTQSPAFQNPGTTYIWGIVGYGKDTLKYHTLFFAELKMDSESEFYNPQTCSI
jgi:predicted ATPase